MKLKRNLRNLLIVMILICNISCDQISKNIVRHRIAYHENISFMSNHLTLTKVENAGAFLSLGDSLPFLFKLMLLSLFPVIALSAGLYFLFTRIAASKTLVLGSCFVIGGGIGNLYDRLRYGSVTDFLHIDFHIFRTGIFNMADVSIMIGVLIILVHLQAGKFRPGYSN